jgi:hypothetical protein
MDHALRRLLFLCLIPLTGLGQSVTTVETYGPVPALQPYNGFGQNLGNNSWEYSTAQAAHVTWGRFDCGWQSPGVEIQNLPANTSGGYTWPSACASQLTYSSTYGIHPIVDALFGPPYGSVGTVTTNTDSPIGTTVVHVTGSLSGVVNSQTAAAFAGGNAGAKGGPYGILITANGSGTITLASANTSDIPSGTSVTLNLLLYPPVTVPIGSNYMTNASVIAYGNYVAYVASQIHSAGLTGQVSLWNEPANGYDPWDHMANFYDSPPGTWENISNNLGMELPLYVASLTMPAGVTIDNGYTEVGGGSGSILAQSYGSIFPWLQATLFQAKATIATESFHPYETNPENDFWLQPCLGENANPADINNIFSTCAPTGSNTGSNFKLATAFSQFPGVFGGLRHSITETGLSLLTGATNTQVTRYDMREFLGYQGLGITPVVFYRLYDNGSDGLEWCTNSTTCYPVLTAFSNLMTDIGTIASTPVAPYSPCMMPRVSSYTGYYPLATVAFVGSQSGNHANSILYYTWQKSYSASNWVTLSSPASVNVSVVVPTGLTVSSLKDMVTSSTVSYTFSGGTLTYPVADDPVEALLVPNSAATPATLTCT